MDTAPLPEDEIFEKARAIADSVERQRFLREACGADSALLARLEGLLKAVSKADALFADATSALANSTIILPTAEATGDRIGRYKLIEKIGEGGCAVVYLAEQEEPVRRKVALKIIKIGLDTPTFVARFEAERQALAVMDHPGIARVFDGGATQSGRPFFVMELVQGANITVYCDQNSLSIHDRLLLFIQVCQAVQHAHQKGIIHRDIKPSNILVASDGGAAIPKVIDFGIAKAMEGRLSEQTLFTAFEHLLGTPAYMSPEQADLSKVDIDTRSDIYSLGALLYELLTGHTPFDTTELYAGGFDDLRRIIRQKDPLRPSEKLRAINATDALGENTDRRTKSSRLIQTLKGELDWIVLKCLEKDPARRYQTVAELAADISRFLNNDTVFARPPTAIYRVQKLFQRHRLLFATSALLALVMLAATIISAGWAMRAHIAEHAEAEQRRIAVVARLRSDALRRNADNNAYAADMLTAQRALTDGRMQRAIDVLQFYVPNPGAPDLRGFEWYYYQALSQGEQTRVLFEQTNAITRAAIDRDRKRLAFYDQAELKVAEVSPFRLIRTWAAPPKAIAMDLSPDGEVVGLITSSNATLFSVSSGTVTNLPIAGVNTLALSESSGGLIAAGKRFNALGEPRDLQVWNYKLSQHLFDLPHAVGPLIRWSANELLTINDDGLMVRWDATTGCQKSSLQISVNTNVVLVFAQISDDQRKGFLTHGNQLLFFNTELTNRTMIDWTSSPRRPALSPDGSLCATSEAVGSIGIIDTTTGARIRTLKGHRDAVSALAFLHNTNELISFGRDGRILYWDLAQPLRFVRQGIGADPAEFPGVHNVSISSDFRFAGTMRQLWKYSDMTPIRTLGGRFLGFSPDSQRYATLETNRVLIWSVEGQTNESVASFILPITNAPPMSSLSADGVYFLSRQFGQLDVIHIKTGRIVASTNHLDATFLANNDLLVETDPGVAIWNWRENLTHVLPSISSAFKAGISADGRLVAGPGQDPREVSLAHLRTGSQRMRLQGHTANILATAFSHDGKTLASLDQTGELRLWSLASLREVGVFDLNAFEMTFSPDDARLIVSSFHTLEILQTARTNLVSNAVKTQTVPADSIWFKP